ncbi:hypothetical protein BDZ97DRAFT_1285220 [Flammula alnicola]|nr:hypothetical protein BDZ97DRAFT_1285220 [Flammula alnicola]
MRNIYEKTTMKYLKLNLPLTKTHLRIITQMSNLRYLALYNPTDHEHPLRLNSNFFQRLSSLKYLSKVQLSGHLELSTHDLQSSNSTVFPALESFWISLTAVQVAQVIPILYMGKFERLETLWLKFPLLPDEGWKAIPGIPWVPFFQTLRLKTTHRFNSLAIDCAGFNPTKLTQWPLLSLSDIPGLLKLHLTRLRIEFPILSTLSNADIQKLTNALPMLTALELSTCLPWQTDFASLVHIAKSLPRLIDLHFGINAQAIPPEDQVPVLSHPLDTLRLTISRLDDPGQFAYCLDKIFPSICACELFWPVLRVTPQKPVSFWMRQNDRFPASGTLGQTRRRG